MNRLRHLGGIAWLAGLLVWPGAAGAAGHKWVTFENCTLIPNPANDGDSFHVRVKKREYIFRLYFVDAPETDTSVPERVDEQAKYFGLTVAQTLQVGKEAERFTAEKLSQPFTVQTRMQDALGRSNRERFYAIVRVGNEDLAEDLVENGLARVHGTSASAPALPSGRDEWTKLESLQAEARRQVVGAWGANFHRMTARSEKEGGKPYDEFGAFFHDTKSSATTPSPQSAPPPAGNRKMAQPGPIKLSVNKASMEELQTVPGIGPAMAARIMAARPFQSADDLRKVKGIGDAIYAKVRPYFE